MRGSLRIGARHVRGPVLVALLIGLALALPARAVVTVVRDHVGPDSSGTDDTQGFTSSFTESNRSVVTYEIPSGNGGVVTAFDVVSGTSFGSCGNDVACYGLMLFRFNVWSDAAAVSANPVVGNLSSTDVTSGLTINQPEFGTFMSGPFPMPTSLLEFDLSSFGITCPSCGCTVSLAADITSSPDLLVVRQSDLPPNTLDTQYPDGSSIPTLLPGPMGVRIEMDVDAGSTCGAPVPSISPAGAVGAAALLLIAAGYALRPRTRSAREGVSHA